MAMKIVLVSHRKYVPLVHVFCTLLTCNKHATLCDQLIASPYRDQEPVRDYSNHLNELGLDKLCGNIVLFTVKLQVNGYKTA